MGWWTDHAVPRITERACGPRFTARYRDRVCAGLVGEVVEIGFGSGHNVPHYPDAVTAVAAVEPSGVGWRLATERVAASRVPVELAGLDGQRLPFADASFDSALCTWTLCTVPDPTAALAELARVLRPGGSLHVVEHGLAPDADVQRWQRRLDPVQTRVAGGCHLSRPVRLLVEEAGWEWTLVEEGYDERVNRLMGHMTLGTARVAG
jgi:SAM-dependent methyltransferase